MEAFYSAIIKGQYELGKVRLLQALEQARFERPLEDIEQILLTFLRKDINLVKRTTFKVVE